MRTYSHAAIHASRHTTPQTGIRHVAGSSAKNVTATFPLGLPRPRNAISTNSGLEILIRPFYSAQASRRLILGACGPGSSWRVLLGESRAVCTVLRRSQRWTRVSASSSHQLLGFLNPYLGILLQREPASQLVVILQRSALSLRAKKPRS